MRKKDETKKGDDEQEKTHKDKEKSVEQLDWTTHSNTYLSTYLILITSFP